jgi:hypothetical protein
MRVLAADQPCSEYYRGHPAALDKLAVAEAMVEAADARERVEGVCAALRCASAPLSMPALNALSDHCPVVVDFPDRDQD